MSNRKDSIESTLNRFKSKAEMHKAIDDMKDGDQAILLIHIDDEDKEIHKFNSYGEITVERGYYLAGNYQNYLMGLMNND